MRTLLSQNVDARVGTGVVDALYGLTRMNGQGIPDLALIME